MVILTLGLSLHIQFRTLSDHSYHGYTNMLMCQRNLLQSAAPKWLSWFHTKPFSSISVLPKTIYNSCCAQYCLIICGSIYLDSEDYISSTSFIHLAPLLQFFSALLATSDIISIHIPSSQSPSNSLLEIPTLTVQSRKLSYPRLFRYLSYSFSYTAFPR